MTFRVRNSGNIQPSTPNYSTGQKIADKIYFEPAKLRDYGGRFLYEPAHIPIEELDSITAKSSSEYMYNYDTTYEKEELMYDKRTGQWRLIPVKDMYKYES